MPTLGYFYSTVWELLNTAIRKEKEILKNPNWREQDGGGVGGCGVHLSPRMHQDSPSDTEVHAEHQLRADRST